MKDLAKEVKHSIKKQNWLVLSSVSSNGIPYSSVLVYQSDGNVIICQTGTNTLKANNIRANNTVAVTIPIRKNFFHKLIPAPPAEIHFTTKAEILPKEDEEARTIFSKFLKHSEMVDLPQENIWIKIQIPNKVTTYGIGVPLFKMRDPNKARNKIYMN
ncbi:MAG: pyridoxamine 5'-phosphate oxidase family protein [Promethearchaeota archaeon]|nr:MAG: pyridoxamine 5'-phosphate oxidase family protein [Candidatus Lokiarchaeota archaeon]